VTETARILLDDGSVEIPDGLRALIRERTAKENLPDLQSEYISVFDTGRDANPIYETEYDRRRAMAKGNELSDIAGFYQAFGFSLDSSLDGMEMLGHVGIELEFYSLMRMKETHLTEAGDLEGAEIVRDARAKFLLGHLGRFVGAISRRPGVQGSGFYGAAFAWSAELVEKECARMGVEPVPADWIDGEELKEEEMNCGPAGGACPA